MIFEVDDKLSKLEPISHSSISETFGKNEKNLEELFKKRIGNEIFPEFLVFGNERSFQREADIFAVGENGELVVFELKVHGHYDRGKVYQAMEYAQLFSKWQYTDMNTHFKKCFPDYDGELSDKFEDHFGYKIDEAKFNLKQKIIVISNSSSLSTNSAAQYWESLGVDIEEYFYRFYGIGDKKLFEVSSELYIPSASGSCWVNTCETYVPGAYRDMISNSKASAYGDRLKVIGEWMSNTNVFLYHNGWGIIAGGIGTKTIKTKSGGIYEEKYIKLRDFFHGVNVADGKIEKYISPSQIKDLLGQNFYFASTIVSLSKAMGDKLYDECKKLFV